jgi:hypothetical protein
MPEQATHGEHQSGSCMTDFTLTFIEGSRGAVPVHASTFDLGETPPPLHRLQREELDRITRAAARYSEDEHPAQKLEKLGRRLGELVLAPPIRTLYDRAHGAAAQRNQLLRVVLRFGGSSWLQTVPWEILHDGRRFLAKDPRSAVVRSFEADDARSPIAIREGPLRVLFTSANPPGSVRIDVEAEEEGLRLAYAETGARVVFSAERRLSLHRLMRRVLESKAAGQEFHVWHHSGHGSVMQKGGAFLLALEDAGRAEYVTIKQVGDVIGTATDLRAVVLNCCRSASLLGLAPELARLSVPVVIGFSNNVQDDSAIRFAAALHQCWLDLPIEIAVSMARRAMRPGGLEWSHPLLFSRRSDAGPFLLSSARSGAGTGAAKAVTPPQDVGGSINVRIQGGARVGSIDHIGGRDSGVGGAPAGPQPTINFDANGAEIGRIGHIGFDRMGTLPAAEARASEERLHRLMDQVAVRWAATR